MTVCSHNLEFDGLPIQLDGPDLEVHPDSANVAFCVGVVLWSRRSEQSRTFTKGRKV